MECKNCHSKWELGSGVTKILTVCPFCEASLADESDEPNIYDNSKDALAHIMRVHGADVLLGSTLKNYFTDYAPGVETLRKNVVFLVGTTGAAGILKNKIGASVGEQEIAFRQAVQKVVDAYGTERSLVEGVVLEFTNALGWKINVSLTVGQRNVKFGKYNWRVLDIQNGKALLLTEDVIEERRYHSLRAAITWEKCELREYLNGAFLQTFSSSEQSRIASVTNTNPDNPWYGTPGGKNTTDKVFLLSIDEVVKYFGDSGDLRARKGWYMEDKQYVLKDGKGYYINDQYNEARIAKYESGKTWWWLRSPGFLDGIAADVDSDGCLDVSGDSVGDSDGGVRPALWINL